MPSPASYDFRRIVGGAFRGEDRKMRCRRSSSGTRGVLLFVLLSVLALGQRAGAAEQSRISSLVPPPYQLGDSEGGHEGIWALLDSGGGHAGWVIRSRPLAPLPGFAGEPLDLLITLDREGRFLDVSLLEQHEPVFVSGLGPGPLEAFLRQYRGHSAGDSLVVASPTGASAHAAASHVYLDGVSRATASVRIANETILAAAREVVRRQMGRKSGASSRPRRDHTEALSWEAMVAQGILRPLALTNADVQQAFSGSPWQNDDPAALDEPGATYLKLWMADVGPSSIARALLDPATIATLDRVLSSDEEPVLLLADGRDPLVDLDFIRNTTPERISATQNGFPLALRHADVEVRLAPGVPAFRHALLLRIDRRLGFDPASAWVITLRVVREHGTFRPDRGGHDFALDYVAQPRFFETIKPDEPAGPLHGAIADRGADLVLLAVGLVVLAGVLWRRADAFSRLPSYPAVRLAILWVTIVFIGFWGQGQLSIVTPLGVLSAIVNAQSLSFLLFDPFSLVLWVATLASLVIWGRGFFCGWLCPYGALQEIAHRVGRRLGLNEYRVPVRIDRVLKRVKYAVLALLAAAAIVSAGAASALVEVEPFKTAITLGFRRDAPLVFYALAWLVLGAFVFKAFCRYVCPLGAMLALAGRIRRWDWIGRRTECGTPCQFCRVQCAYAAIDHGGAIDYAECFQCLDCVRIDKTPTLCVADRLAQGKGRRLRRQPAQ